MFTPIRKIKSYDAVVGIKWTGLTDRCKPSDEISCNQDSIHSEVSLVILGIILYNEDINELFNEKI